MPATSYNRVNFRSQPLISAGFQSMNEEYVQLFIFRLCIHNTWHQIIGLHTSDLEQLDLCDIYIMLLEIRLQPRARKLHLEGNK